MDCGYIAPSAPWSLALAVALLAACGLTCPKAKAAEGPPAAVPADMAQVVSQRAFVKDGVWTRSGALKSPPARITDLLPLSDQTNAEGWVPYEPMTDEFAGTELDSDKWWPTDPGWTGRQPGYFEPANVEVRDGQVGLWMRLAGTPEALKAEGYGKYSTALVKSKEPVLYGYFEVRAKAGSTSSAFWLYRGDDEQWTEIDIFEIAGAGPTMKRDYNMNVHVFRSPTVTEHFDKPSIWKAPWDLGADYHVYGLAWDADLLRYYVDGVLVRATKNTHWHQALDLCLDSETMGDWMGIPADAVLPTVFSVDYVRAWKRQLAQPLE